MLKFNIEEHKLEEIEKYGVIKKMYYGYTSVLNNSVEDDVSIDIDNETYKINLTVDENYWAGTMNGILETLYDLIKNGLIIKE